MRSTDKSLQCFPPRGLSISIVVYQPDREQLQTTIQTLGQACTLLLNDSPKLPIDLYLIDNGGASDCLDRLKGLIPNHVNCHLLSGHGNIGYGSGHNLAIRQVQSRFHLILNPDVDLDPVALVTGYSFLEAHPDTGLLTPYIMDEKGDIQYLCRRMPTIPDLFIRGFLSGTLKSYFSARLARYEMHHLINDHDIVWDPEIVSGCFMLFRTDILQRLNGFDPRYFLYFEDYDLSLRTHKIARIAYVPSVKITHHGGGAARKGLWHIRLFAASAFRFYRRFGWRLW